MSDITDLIILLSIVFFFMALFIAYETFSGRPKPPWQGRCFIPGCNFVTYNDTAEAAKKNLDIHNKYHN